MINISAIENMITKGYIIKWVVCSGDLAAIVMVRYRDIQNSSLSLLGLTDAEWMKLIPMAEGFGMSHHMPDNCRKYHEMLWVI